MAEARENVIEWITGDDCICCTFTQKKHINLVRRLVATYINNGDNRADLVENPDGSVFCHIPLEALKLKSKTIRTMSDEQRGAIAERLRVARESKVAVNGDD